MADERVRNGGVPDERTFVPAEARAAVAAVVRVLGHPPIAAYLTGSAVAGGLRPLSDVDVFVVVAGAPDPGERRRLADALAGASGRYGAGGPVRPLDVTLVRLAAVVPWRYPPERAFVYGEWLRADYADGDGPEPGPSPDLAIQVAQVRALGHVLQGPPAPVLLDPVPAADLHGAMRDALPALIEDGKGDERNVLLTLARMWRTASTFDFVPKDVAAAWAAARLPAALARTLTMAERAYRGEEADDWRGRGDAVAELAARLRREVEGACGSR